MAYIHHLEEGLLSRENREEAGMAQLHGWEILLESCLSCTNALILNSDSV